MATNPEALLPPGFRFHPTDEELVVHYLSKQVASRPCPVPIIAEVDIYKFNPWDLPAKAAFGDREWYFFSPRDRKYPNGVRPNRAAASGYWKATGTDKPIVAGGGRECIGVKKALVFYKGRPPKGSKTDWIMHEYRLVESLNPAHPHPHLGRPKRPRDSSMTMRLDDWVLCRIYKKCNNLPGSSSDRDAEDSASEDAHFPPALGAGAAQDGAKLPKSSSLSDLLDDADFSVLTRLLHENPPDVAGPDQFGPLLGLPSMSQSFVLGDSAAGGGFGFSLPMLAPVESPAPVVGGCLKRQRVPAAADGEEGGGALSHPPKKYDSSCNNRGAVVGHADAAPPQFSMLNQPFPYQQILLNSRWGL